MAEASLANPSVAKQEIHGGAITDKVGQKHEAVVEQMDTTLEALAHSAEQMQTVARYDEIVAA